MSKGNVGHRLPTPTVELGKNFAINLTNYLGFARDGSRITNEVDQPSTSSTEIVP
jgi:hypothetical protein